MMKKICSRLLLEVLLLLLVGAAGVYAQSGAGYDLSWSTVDGGGSTTTEGGGYTLMSTAGQPDAGPTLKGGGYSLTGGFWPGGVADSGTPSGPGTIYLPVVMK
jgi:hypothetical protein